MPADPRSLLVIDTRELDRRPGSTRHVHQVLDAPAGLEVPSASVHPGSPLELDVDVDSVVDGVWVSGTATARVQAECVRCLTEFEFDLTADLEALYVAGPPEPVRGDAGSRGERDRSERHTAGRVGLDADDESDGDTVFALDGDLLDLEQVVRDAVVLALPLRPLDAEDCPGLRLDGTRADPGERSADVDPRWAALAGLAGEDELRGPADGAAVPGKPRT